MKRINGLSLNLERNNIDKIKELFPEAVEEGKIDFDMLRAMLGDEVDDSREKYQFTWNGKAKAIKLAQTPSSATLRPCKNKSKYWDTTENLYIEGDNLEVLKQLQKTYYGKIKMIYIDPPYNTGNDFVYHDDFRNSIENYKEQTNQVGSSNPESNGRFHTDWLNMMYPRLILAKNLLTDKGVLVLSIDDNEITNLRVMCDEIFGEKNFVNCFIWNCSTAGGIRPKFASKTHEYILCYAKNKNNLDQINAPLSSDAIKMYNQKDSKGLYRDKDFIFKNKSNNINQRYEIECPDGEKVHPKDGYIYRFIKDSFEDALKNDMVTFKRTKTGPLLNENNQQANWNIYIKKYLGDGTGAPSTLVPKEMLSIYNVGTQCVQDLFEGKRVFENVKPVDVISYFLNMFCDKNSTVLDFFSGSATTAHAVMERNCKNNILCNFIMVQLPEVCNKKSEAYKAGYNNICEIGEERIRRAGEKIKVEWEKEHLSDGLFNSDTKFTTDIGFKVFKLDSTNVNEWDPNMKLDEKELAMRLGEVFKEDRSKEDILYEIMLKYGVFDKQVEEIKVNDKTMYRVGKRYMIVCLDYQITSEDVKAIAELSPRTVIFNEAGFNNDNDKINAVYNLEKAGVEDVKCI